MAESRLTVAEAFGDSTSITAPQYFGLTQATNSIFNKFTLFRFHKYGPSYTSYNAKYHLDGNDASTEPSPDQDAAAKAALNQTVVSTNPYAALAVSAQQAQESAQLFQATGTNKISPVKAEPMSSDDVITFQNPTASAIIKWAQRDNKIWGPTPYAWTDFIYCKYNGKIPNNRLVTLRRFPVPVRDNLKTIGGENLIPISQAVTWFGEGTGNKLANIIPGLSWALPFKMLDAQDQNLVVQGNNITLDDLIAGLEKLPLGVGTKIKDLSNTLKGLSGAMYNVNGDTAQVDQASKKYEKIQEFIKNQLYSSTGPYWNQILGGVNYITQTMVRDRFGANLSWQNPITLNFHYALRSFNSIKPKIAMLDLISNFLSLTFMNMEFKGNFSRFFRNAGISSNVAVDEQIGTLFQENKFVEALQLIATSVGHDVVAATSNSSDLKSISNGLDNVVSGGKVSNKLEKAINGYLAATIGSNLAKGPVVMRSTLSGVETGEWHLVIGNPIEPIATIGNLICTGCTMTFGEELGPDDFPTEVTFEVKLQMAKPRDKYMIDSMFNLGNGFLTENPIQPPMSGENSGTFSSNSADNYSAIYNSSVKNDLLSSNASGKSSRDAITVAQRLNIAYGPVYANSGILPLYFMDNTSQKANASQTSGSVNTPSKK